MKYKFIRDYTVINTFVMESLIDVSFGIETVNDVYTTLADVWMGMPTDIRRGITSGMDSFIKDPD
jgi:hypothetical protein